MCFWGSELDIKIETKLNNLTCWYINFLVENCFLQVNGVSFIWPNISTVSANICTSG